MNILTYGTSVQTTVRVIRGEQIVNVTTPENVKIKIYQKLRGWEGRKGRVTVFPS